jgi:Na+-driven multidrug efflux pump
MDVVLRAKVSSVVNMCKNTVGSKLSRNVAELVLVSVILLAMVFMLSGGVGILSGSVTTGQGAALVVLYMIITSVLSLGIYLSYLTARYKYSKDRSLYLTLSIFLLLSGLLIGMAIS